MNKNNKADIVEVVFHAFEDYCFLDESEQLKRAEEKLKISLSEKQKEMFLKYQVEMDYQVFKEERLLIRFVLDFIKDIKK